MNTFANYFHNLSLKKKLILIFLSVSIVTVVTGGITAAIIGIDYVKDYKIRWLKHMAITIGDNNAHNLEMSYKSHSEEILDKLRLLPDIKYCTIYNSDGELFARYSSAEEKPLENLHIEPEISYGRIHGEKIIVQEPIMKNGVYIGHIRMIADLMLNVLIAKILTVMIIVIILFVVISYFLGLKIREIISRPIGKLIEISEEISNTGNYSLRADTDSRDEVGKFSIQFNSMLEVIQSRDMELLSSNEKFTNIFNAQSDSIIILNIKGDILDVNHSTLRMLSISRVQALNLNLFTQLKLKSDSTFSIKELLDKTISDGFSEFEGECLKPLTNNTINLQIKIRRLDISEPPLLIMSAKDVTIQKRDEHELASLRDYLSNVINSMPSTLVGVDNEGRITQWNDHASEVTGVQHRVAIGQRLQDLFPHLKPELDKIETAIKEHKVQRLTRKAHNTKGHQKIEDITIYPLTGENVEGAVLIIDDITDRVNMEKMMIQSEKMMSIGGLAAGMAHEINNPLAGIIQNTQIIQNRLLKASSKNIKSAEEAGIVIDDLKKYVTLREIDKMLNYIKESGVRASVIVKNMLSFSRKGVHENIASSVTDLLDKTIELAFNEYNLKKKLDFRKINIVKHYEEPLPKIMCDPGSIQQVFLNILKNGAQAMQTKNAEHYSPEINISVSKYNNNVRIVIRDNGPGIPENMISNIFEPFFTTKEVGEGTGLGMSVSYFIITDKHGGKISVKSQEGEWTSFIIELPAIDNKEA